MPQSDPLTILFAHDLWANHQMLSACKPLSEEQFHRRFEMGPGSLHDTMTHVVTAMRIWCDRLAGRDMRARLEGNKYGVEQIGALLDEAAAELAALAMALPLGETIAITRNGVSRVLTRGAVVTHVTTHGMHHRAQVLNMLRQVGAKPLPASSVVEWTMTEAAS